MRHLLIQRYGEQQLAHFAFALAAVAIMLLLSVPYSGVYGVRNCV